MKTEKLKMDFPTEMVEEGEVKVLVPKLSAFVKKSWEYAPSKAPVFYNPVMELNRDIAVLAMQAYQRTLNRQITICEPLAGCGIRGIRFAREVENIKKVLVNDINEKAYQLAKYNVEFNKLGKRITVKNEDANLLLARYGAPYKRFDAIDLDPFGSPTPFLDSAIRAIRDGGLLALTATDMAPLCGVHPKACIRKYGGKPLRTEYCHELAVRLLAGCLAITAARHEIGVKTVFSHSTDHYVRVYATLQAGAEKADESLKQMGYILHCFNCFHREALKGDSILGHNGKCIECGSKMSLAGPLWLGRLSDRGFCEAMEAEAKRVDLKNSAKINRILTLVKEESDAPITYYVLDKICDKLSLTVPSLKKIRNLLKREGFQAFLTHFSFKGLKTNASATALANLLQRVACET
ncbi:MAG: tRNA (guanine(10)-N(2))-dimethyltransferase [Candidatus Bathyarchaeales archaeon]